MRVLFFKNLISIIQFNIFFLFEEREYFFFFFGGVREVSLCFVTSSGSYGFQHIYKSVIEQCCLKTENQ